MKQRRFPASAVLFCFGFLYFCFAKVYFLQYLKTSFFYLKGFSFRRKNIPLKIYKSRLRSKRTRPLAP